MSNQIRSVTLIALFAFLCALPSSAGGRSEGESRTKVGSPTGPRVTYPLTITDDSGARLTIPAKPVRIVSLTLPTDEILLSLVDPARISALTVFASDPEISNVSEAAAGVPVKMNVNVEAVIGLSPDVVFVANWTEANKVAQLRAAGLTVFLIQSASTVQEISRQIESVARIVGEPEKGAGMIARMEERIAAVQRKVSAIPPDRRLKVIDYEIWGTSMGAGSSWDQIVSAAGLVNAVGGFQTDDWGQVPVSKEKLLEIDPDILILPGWVYGDPEGADGFRKQTLSDPALRGMKAIQSGRVRQMPERLKSTTSQYIAEAVEFLAATAYPELFP
jgi:iron complex transport system substrate-binding protein